MTVMVLKWALWWQQIMISKQITAAPIQVRTWYVNMWEIQKTAFDKRYLVWIIDIALNYPWSWLSFTDSFIRYSFYIADSPDKTILYQIFHYSMYTFQNLSMTVRHHHEGIS